MKKCEDCLAYYNKDHTCPPLLKPKKYCSRECYRETLKKRASDIGDNICDYLQTYIINK